MMFLDSLRNRRQQAELMDDPALEPARHALALRGLARINWLSRSDRILWQPLARLAFHRPGGSLRVLDIATGGGDVPIRLWLKARRAGFNWDVHACDISPTALALAGQKAETAGAQVKFFSLDIHNAPIPDGFDVITCSLFLHHQAEAEAISLLRHLREVAGAMVLVNDLRRCRLGYSLAWLAGRLLTRSDVVRVDGPRSVEGAFSLAEARALACAAGMANAEITRKWPCRFLLAWRRG